jgi:hypothetical protein
MHQAVWADVEMSVGMVWWREICEQIRSCDGMIVAVSPNLVESEASSLERQYAHALHKPVLPVCIKPVRPELLPPDLAQVQFVNYCDPTPEAAFELAAALSGLPPAPPLPDPLPPEPAVPGNYWFSVSEQVHASDLGLDQQLALVARLRDDMHKPADRERVWDLLHILASRRDLFAATFREIDELLKHEPDAQGDGSGPVKGSPWPDRAPVHPPEQTPAETLPPSGWYSDPTRRYRLRWFDQDWSDWVSNGGPTLLDPL